MIDENAPQTATDRFASGGYCRPDRNVRDSPRHQSQGREMFRRIHSRRELSVVIRNMIHRLREMFPSRRPQVPNAAASSLTVSDLENMPPGQTMRITVVGGSDFVVMHADDFQHILELAGLESISASSITRE